MKFKEKMQSRKFMLVILIIIMATLGAFIPPIVGIFGVALKILSGAEWVTVVSLVISAYIAGNSWQNRAEISAGTVEDTHIRTIIQEKKSDVASDEEFENKEEAEA